MENHPIPQDVTGFQFKLVGNMTLKQFGYVGAGVIMCVIFFYAPLNFFIKFPLFMLSALTGVGLAFVPIEGRPMDLMLSNFAKAILQPNQFVYHKVGGSLSFNELDLHPIVVLTPAQAQKQAAREPRTTPQKEERLREFLYDMSSGPQTGVDEKEAKYLSLFAQQDAAGYPAQTPIAQPAPIPAAQYPTAQQNLPAYPVQMPGQIPAGTQISVGGPVQQTPPVAPQPQAPMFQYPVSPQPAPASITPPVQNTPLVPQVQPQPAIPMQPAAPVIQPAPLQAVQPVPPVTQQIPVQPSVMPQPPIQVAQVMPQPQPVAVSPVQAPVPVQNPSVTPQAVIAPQPAPVAPVIVTSVPAGMPQPVAQQPQAPTTPIVPQVKTTQPGTGVPAASEFPNVVTGVVKDARGNVLSGILIEVKNKEGDSVRAFKTNALGQFASATQLNNGSYIIEFEDPRAKHTFAKVPVEANGSIISPLEVISVDDREELRKQLFG